MKTRYEPRKRSLRGKAYLAFVSALILFHLAQPCFAAQLSELLEKGIYSEETKGDLDAALKLYEQIVTDGKAGQALAAQAEYRLGVCYYKKKDYRKARIEFEKLRKDFPEQKELVALAQEYLAADSTTLLPVPWADGELLRLDIKLGSGYRIGPATYSANSGELNGRKVWKLGSRLFAGVQQLSSVEVDADSFKPLHSRWKHTLFGDVDALYSTGHADLKFKGKDEVKKVDLEGIVYDNEEVVQLMRRLPLATNYSTQIQIISTLAGGNLIPLKIEVAAIDKIQVAAGSFDCYRVELSVKQTFWYSTDEHHYLVKFEAGGVTAELVSIEQTTPGQPVTFKMASPALSLTAPSGWLIDSREPDEAKAPTKIIILDPDATANSFLFVNSVDNLKLKPEEKKSLRACADAQIIEGTRNLKELKVRADTWKERTVAGQPALSVVADFVETRQPKVGYLVFTFLGDNALQFLTWTDPADFEAFRPQFDAIIDSCKPGS